jgi:hypothetical protein
MEYALIESEVAEVSHRFLTYARGVLQVNARYLRFALGRYEVA